MPARALSVSRQISERNERKPFGLPSVNGELANSAVATGCSASAHPHLAHHVGFGGEVVVRLHRAGAVHHVEAERADLRHVGGHDLVAALRHLRDVGAGPARRHAEPEEADIERTRHLAHLRQVGEQFARGLVHVVDRRAGQFELAAGLERDRAAAGDVGEPDDVLALHDRLPAEQFVHAVEQRADAARPRIGHRPVIVHAKGKLFVLRADAEFRLRLAARLEPRDEFVARFDRRHIDLVAGHSGFRRKKVATLTTGRWKGQS